MLTNCNCSFSSCGFAMPWDLLTPTFSICKSLIFTALYAAQCEAHSVDIRTVDIRTVDIRTVDIRTVDIRIVDIRTVDI